MKNILFKVTFFIALTLGACKKDNQIETQPKPNQEKKGDSFFSSMFGATVCDGNMQYIASCHSWMDTAGNVGQSVYYNGKGVFYNNPVTRRVNVGNVSWGSLILPPDSSLGRLRYEFNNTHFTNPINQTQFGSMLNFDVAGGSGYAGCTINMYVPEEIYLVPEQCSCSSPVIYSNRLPKTIFWNQDVNNPNDVVVMIEYNGFRSNLKTPSFSNASFFTPAVNTPDNGQFNLTPNMFIGMPFGSIITVHVGRANQEDVTDANGKVVAVTAYTYTSQDYIYAQ